MENNNDVSKRRLELKRVANYSLSDEKSEIFRIIKPKAERSWFGNRHLEITYETDEKNDLPHDASDGNGIDCRVEIQQHSTIAGPRKEWKRLGRLEGPGKGWPFGGEKSA